MILTAIGPVTDMDEPPGVCAEQGMLAFAVGAAGAVLLIAAAVIVFIITCLVYASTGRKMRRILYKACTVKNAWLLHLNTK